MSDEESYTKEEVEAYGKELIRNYAQEKANTHSFFTKVIQHNDTTRIGNITVEELGDPQITVRGLKELETFSRTIEKNDLWADWFKSMAEVTNATSLSKEGFLLRLSVTQKKELADVTSQAKKQNKGWFKSKKDSDTQ